MEDERSGVVIVECTMDELITSAFQHEMNEVYADSYAAIRFVICSSKFGDKDIPALVGQELLVTLPIMKWDSYHHRKGERV
jgi:hypothetical protein